MPIPLGILDFPSGGGVAAYDLLDTTVLSSNASYIELTGLDSYTDYRHLQLRWTFRSNRSSSQDAVYFYVNSDFNTSNYMLQYLYGNGSSLSASYANPNSLQVDIAPAAGGTGSIWSSAIMDVLNYKDTNNKTTFRTMSGSVGSTKQLVLWSGLYIQHDAIDSVWFQPYGGSFVTGSRLSVYGVR